MPIPALDKRPNESWHEYWGRKHDEKHGKVCTCIWNTYCRMSPLPVPGVGELDTTAAGKRLISLR